MSIIAATFAIMLVLLALSCPILVAIGLSTIIGIWLGDLKLALFTQKFFNTFDSFPLMACPFFILAGDIMSAGTLSKTLIAWCQSLYGHLRGGLAHISTITCLFYGALCGSAVATVAADGGTTIPAMERERLASLRKALPAIGIPVIILGGIYGGVFSPTEAGVVAVAYALVVEKFISRTLTWNSLCDVISHSMLSLGMIIMVAIVASGLGTLLLYYNFHIMLKDWLMGLNPILMPAAEMLPGIQQGVVDCMDVNIPAMIQFRIYDVAKHVILMNQPQLATLFACSNEFWDDLPDADKKIWFFRI